MLESEKTGNNLAFSASYWKWNSVNAPSDSFPDVVKWANCFSGKDGNS